ncbi:hypothetical protein LSM04_007967 [Trypanosoma melophagium]|uniref:uncharacterized protein n=1 Tax=Trypanosoma melophagium TaxID=715481 RepID=UPI00351A7685|nr:hypothetical protein LSM04_007967 [Trypanosoma melophagium]
MVGRVSRSIGESYLENDDESSLTDVLIPLSRVLNGEFDCRHCRQLRLRIAHLERELESARARDLKQKDELRRLRYAAGVQKYEQKLNVSMS